MKKISENVDLSRKVLEINVDSEIFNCIRHDLNLEIKRVVRQVYEERFECGEVNLKLKITLPKAYENIERIDPVTRQPLTDTYSYRKPDFEHTVSTTLKKQFKTEGAFNGDKREVQVIDGEFVAVPIKEAQMHISEFVE